MKRFYSAILIWLVIAPALIYGEGSIDSLKEYEYWPDGKVRGCKVYDTNGRLKAKSWCRSDGSVERIEKYDLRGNKIQQGFFDQRGKLKTGIDGWAVMRWEYDDEGRMRSQMSFDELGRPIERKLFSEGGKMVLRQIRDSDKLDPYEEAQMAMFLGGANVKMKNPDE